MLAHFRNTFATSCLLTTLTLTALTLTGLTLTALTLTGCGGGSTTASELRLSAVTGAATFAPTITTSVFKSTDENTADIFLTDLPLDRLANTRDDLSDLAGNFIHIRLFLVPAAGKTPIDPTACNVAVNHFVFAQGATGVYSGGGFMSVSDTPTGTLFGGTLENVSVRLTRATPNFADRLGASTLTGTIEAPRNEETAKALEARTIRLLSTLRTTAAPGKLP